MHRNYHMAYTNIQTSSQWSLFGVVAGSNVLVFSRDSFT